MLEIGELAPDERVAIEARMIGQRPADRGCADPGDPVPGRPVALRRPGGHGQAGFALKHVEFVAVRPGKALVIMVSEDGQVENRIIDTPAGLPVSALIEASNYLNARLAGRTIDTARAEILAELESERAMLDALTAKVVAEGLATLTQMAGAQPRTVTGDDKVLIVRGQSHLLDSVEAQADIERVRTLFEDIERKNDLIRLLELAKEGDGVRIFIGSENRLFCLSGSSIVAAPYANAAGKIVGVIGVLGPTRLNYGRIIPMVDHTAKVIGRLLGAKSLRNIARFAEAHTDAQGTAMSDEQNPRSRCDDNPHAAEFAVLEALKAEVESLKDQRLRALAEAENIRRRAEKETQAKPQQYAVTKFARDMLGIADNFCPRPGRLPARAARCRRPADQGGAGRRRSHRPAIAGDPGALWRQADGDRRQVRSQSASGDRRSAGQRQAAGHHRGCGADRLHDRRPACCVPPW